MSDPVKVLYIEDEALIRMAFAESLQELGLDLVEADTIASARKLLQNDPGINFILTDFRLPDGTSAQFVKELREAGNFMPVLVVSGNAAEWQDSTKLHPEIFGDIETCTKPVHCHQIFEKIMVIAKNPARAPLPDRRPRNGPGPV